MSAILKDKSFRLAFILTFIFLGTGVVFLYTGLAFYGPVIFLFLPIVLGISIGALPNRKWAYWGLIVSVVTFLALLVVGAVEGFICVVMALAIVASGIFIGTVITHLILRYKKIKGSEQLHILILPLIAFLVAAPAERMILGEKESVSEVRSEILLPYSPEQVFDAVKSMDTLIAEKPFLMKLDLPVPYKCVLEKEEVGAVRTCYFEGGSITERITAVERGKILRMDVIGYELMAAKWLGFKEAIYLFESTGHNQCKMTRITTYTSKLKPRFYWQPLEKIGIEQEHAYVFASLANKLSSGK